MIICKQYDIKKNHNYKLFDKAFKEHRTNGTFHKLWESNLSSDEVDKMDDELEDFIIKDFIGEDRWNDEGLGFLDIRDSFQIHEQYYLGESLTQEEYSEILDEFYIGGILSCFLEFKVLPNGDSITNKKWGYTWDKIEEILKQNGSVYLDSNNNRIDWKEWDRLSINNSYDVKPFVISLTEIA